MSPKKLPKLPRQTVWMDERGRIVVPEYMRDALGLETTCWVVIERYPAEGECKSIFLKKGQSRYAHPLIFKQTIVHIFAGT